MVILCYDEAIILPAILMACWRGLALGVCTGFDQLGGREKYRRHGGWVG